MECPYEIVPPEPGEANRVRARGTELMRQPLLYRGTAFTVEQRHELGLTGLLPSGVTTLEGQVRRTYAQYFRHAHVDLTAQLATGGRTLKSRTGRMVTRRQRRPGMTAREPPACNPSPEGTAPAIWLPSAYMKGAPDQRFRRSGALSARGGR
jgi:hypothetical protein